MSQKEREDSGAEKPTGCLLIGLFSVVFVGGLFAVGALEEKGVSYGGKLWLPFFVFMPVVFLFIYYRSNPRVRYRVKTQRIIKLLVVFAGPILCGKGALLAASLKGRDSSAGYPFPDLEGFILFWSCAILIPIGVAILIFLTQNYNFAKRLRYFSIPTNILILGPLIGSAVGYFFQLTEIREKETHRQFDAAQISAYKNFAAELTADPAVVLRERWYEDDPTLELSSKSARRMAFDHSFDINHLKVPYTVNQLKEIFRLSPEARLSITNHPMCPSDLIVTLWNDSLLTMETSSLERLIKNPARPRYLFEDYQKRWTEYSRLHSVYIKEAIDRRLNDDLKR
jgi:hypothetical protein